MNGYHVHFKFFAHENEMPIVTTKNGETIELPLVSTQIETRVKSLPQVTLGIRARHVDIVTCGEQGWPQVMFEGQDLVDLLMVSKVDYVSGNNPGDGTVTLMIELGPHDSVTFE